MKSASRDDAVSSSKAAKAAASKGKDSESSVDPVHYRFKKGQRVMFYDNKGEKHYGTVGWTGNSTRTRTFDYILVGIRTVSVCDQGHMGGCNSFNGRITI